MKLIKFFAFSVMLIGASNIYASDEPTSFTKKINNSYYNELNFNDKQSFEDAHKGFIAPLSDKPILDSKGNVIWDIKDFSFLKEGSKAPNTVNPSLWRNGQLLNITGLFKVVDGVYQVRGYGLALITFIETKNGVIVMDTGEDPNIAKAAVDLYFANRPKKPIKAIIVSHSHVDHFSGMQGVFEVAKNPNLKIIAPVGFIEESVSENLTLGNAMFARGSYQGGVGLEKSPKEQVSTGLGLGGAKNITMGIMSPTDTITKDGQEVTIDGLKIVFFLAQHTEAPSEMFFYIPKYKVFCVAEDSTQTLHNILTLRGAKTRDTLEWINALKKVQVFMEKNPVDALISVHSWPVWGENAKKHIEMTKDIYKFMHDQTIRLANEGYDGQDIATMVKLPKALNQYWGTRPYYGSLEVNLRAIYTFYQGWYNGNPANLNALSRVEEAKKYVEYMGGEANILAKAKADFNKGNYRWVASVLDKVIYANPNNKKTKELLAKTYRQLAYQTENGIWRNSYLIAAHNLMGAKLPSLVVNSSVMLDHIDMPAMLSVLATHLNGTKADGKSMVFNLVNTDDNKTYVVTLNNSVLDYVEADSSSKADFTLEGNKMLMMAVLFGKADITKLSAAKKLTYSGNINKIKELSSLFDEFNPNISVITPNK